MASFQINAKVQDGAFGAGRVFLLTTRSDLLVFDTRGNMEMRVEGASSQDGWIIQVCSLSD